MKVLLIEDDAILGESLVEYTRNHGIETTWLQDEGRFAEILSVKSFDVIVLDLILRRQRGEDILLEIRAMGVTTPVLVLTAKRELQDKETCFDRGADDYLTKPFEPKELLLRIRALSKRKVRESVVSIGKLKVDTNTKTVWREGGEQVNLSARAWDLLYLLLKNRGRLVTKEQILSYVWGDTVVGEEVIRFYIKELRKVLSKDSIKTMKGRGYILS